MTHEQRWDTLGRGGGPERPKERPFFEITPARRRDGSRSAPDGSGTFPDNSEKTCVFS